MPRSNWRTLPFLLTIAAFYCALAGRTIAQTPTPLPQFALQLSTNRGCLEDGDNAFFLNGEGISISLRVGSADVSQARATLYDILPSGFVSVFPLGTVATNQTFSFSARIAPPFGIERLLLRANAPGVKTTQRICSFWVLHNGTPAPTRTPSMTRTPTPTQPTRTPTATRTVPTPGQLLDAQIRTNRGCLEDGDDPIFAVGESIAISFRINSSSTFAAQATIYDILANGFAQAFNFGVVSTNRTHVFNGRIAPPAGIERLQLRARAFGSFTSIDNCSFNVVSGPLPTRTRTSTRTASPTPSPTETPM